jgi:hypothetical protein
MCTSSGCEETSLVELNSTIVFPVKSDIVYVIGFEKEARFIPIYIGESRRNIGRFGDYVAANFSASTDFKVGRAVKYLDRLGFKVLIKYGETTDRRRDQKILISRHRLASYKLLNDLAGYHYKFADKKKEEEKIESFMNDLLSGLSKTSAGSNLMTNVIDFEHSEPITIVSEKVTVPETRLKNHERFAKTFKGYTGQEFTTKQIEEILLRTYPDFSLGSILPNDHAGGNKSPCWCAKTADRVFDRIDRGLYRVR